MTFPNNKVFSSFVLIIIIFIPFPETISLIYSLSILVLFKNSLIKSFLITKTSLKIEIFLSSKDIKESGFGKISSKLILLLPILLNSCFNSCISLIFRLLKILSIN